MFDVPNLDDMSIDPVDYAEAALVFEQLAKYCRLKMYAMRQRKLGKINLAQDNEQEMERMYREFPDWVRW